MRFDYDKSTDSLFIKVADGVYDESEEIAENFIVDFDKEGRVVGLDIQYASKTMPGFDHLSFTGMSPVIDVDKKPMKAVAASFKAPTSKSKPVAPE
jgi:uncharacterized protein YuzE